MIKYTIKNSIGLHARPAAAFCAEAKKHDIEIELKVVNEVYNAKSLLAIMSAGIEKDTVIEISAKGSQGAKVEQALIDVLNKHAEL